MSTQSTQSFVRVSAHEPLTAGENKTFIRRFKVNASQTEDVLPHARVKHPEHFNPGQVGPGQRVAFGNARPTWRLPVGIEDRQGR